jgi:hypothetical protein
MGDPVCRMCWLASLPDAERERIVAETVTMPVFLCVKHQAVMDEMLAAMPPVRYIKVRDGNTPADFPRA